MGKLKLKRLLVVLVAYLAIIVASFSWIGDQLEEMIGWQFPWIVKTVQYGLLAYLGLTMWAAYFMYRRGKRGSDRFKVYGPFWPYGLAITEFQHVFHHRENILAEMVGLMGAVVSQPGVPRA
jgi:hypothetical protein